MDVTVDNPKNAWRTELAGPSPAEAALAAVKAAVTGPVPADAGRDNGGGETRRPHMMLDLETMGNGPRAAIAAIGAVLFDPLDPLWRGDFGLDDDVPEDVVRKEAVATYRDWLANECADVAIYLDLLLYQLRRDLGEAVRRKFNRTSDKIGVEVKL